MLTPPLPPRRLRSSFALAVVACAVTAGASAGLLEGEPFVSYKLSRDSNLFRFESDAEAVAAHGDAERADTLQRYGAGLALQYSFGLQRAYAGGEVYRQTYQRFDELDHDGRRLRAGLDWQLGPAASGELRLDRERRIESFADRDGTQPNFQRDHRFDAAATLSITPRWALQTRLDARRLRNTLEVSRNYDLDETSVAAGGLYLGRPVGEAGLLGEYTRGRFPERPGGQDGVTQRYVQTSLKLNALWRPSGLSTLRGELGHSRRDNRGPDTEDVSGPTGLVAYERKWSGKTRLAAEIYRRLVSVEEIDASSVVQTGLAGRLDWQLRKLGLFGRYEIQRQDYDGSPVFDLGGEDRRDDTQIAQLGLDWQPLFWFTLSPAIAYEERDSNRSGRSYEDLLLSLDLEARYD